MQIIKCRKIGNAKGFIIPSKYLFKVDIEVDDQVKLSIDGNKIVLEKVPANQLLDNSGE